MVTHEDKRYFDGKKVSAVCIIANIKTQITKNGKLMAFVTAEDRTGSMELVVFPNVYDRCAALLNEGNAVIVRGNLSYKENEEPKIICDSIDKARKNGEVSENNPYKEEQPVKKPVTDNPSALYLRIDDLNTPMYEKARRVLDIFEGRTPVIFYLTDTNRKVKAPTQMWVSLNDVMIKELKFQLGEKNVVVK